MSRFRKAVKRIYKKCILRIKAFYVLVRRGKAAAKLYISDREDRSVKNTSWDVSEAELNRQRKTVFDRQIKISVLVPLYNTDKKFLKEMIESVRAQTYSNFELCLADGSDADHGNVGRICAEYAKKDARIRYRKLEKNLGISENTNECIRMATGDYIALFDHDDILHRSALYYAAKAVNEENADFIYTDENTFATHPREAYCPNFKPDFAPDTLRSYNYICHLSVFSRKLLDRVGYFSSECDGSQDYDLILRLTEKAEKICHIPKVLYYWRASAASTALDISAKPYIMDAAKTALANHLKRVGLRGEVKDAEIPSTYRIDYELEGTPKISVMIPNMDHIEDLDKCIKSCLKSTYTNFEIVVVENNSRNPETFAYYGEIQKDERIRVVTFETDEFNFSAICNFAAANATGDYYLFLNNDIEIINADWLENMLMFAQRKDVGAVGAKLYYDDDIIQHAGVILGVGGVAGHANKGIHRSEYGYMSRAKIIQNFSAVTAALLLMPKHVFNEIGGFDEGFKVAFNDIDLCMRIREKGYLIVFTPYAEAYHYESKSRGYEDNPEKVKRFNGEIARFQKRWGKELEKGDPYYNPNLRLDSEKFEYYNN